MLKKCCAILGLALTLGASAATRPWWQGAVIYEIYPRSFADSNGDGIGDLNGITAHLDYLKDLGVDAIWLTPIYPSPQVDFGYDISDFTAIDPAYGSMADFDRMVAEAKKRQIRVIMDFVINHSSDRHPWFEASRSSKQSPYRDWYIWRDGKDARTPPNNWQGIFGTPAWSFDDRTGQFYYHAFYPEQPDLNWRNPAVEKAMFDVTRFWYGHGVAGFRLDAVDRLFEDPALTDNEELPGLDDFGRHRQKESHTVLPDEVHAELQKLRKVADESKAVLIGETWTDDVHELARYFGPHQDELQLPMDLLFTQLPFSAQAFRDHIDGLEKAEIWPTYVISNHDIRRSYDRYGDGLHNDQIAKLMAALTLTLRGSVMIYQGEEIGMRTNDPTSLDQVKDPVGRLGWPKVKGRDGERTPMQWNGAAQAGFTSGTPWLPIPASAASYNVALENQSQDSILNHYKALIRLRRQPALHSGRLTLLARQDGQVLSYLRQSEDQTILVALNMSGQVKELPLLTGGQTCAVLLASAGACDHGRVTLQPFGLYVGAVR